MKNNILKSMLFALTVTTGTSLISWDYQVVNNLKKSTLSDNDMVVDFRWAAGSQENVPFVNNVAKFSTPGIWCLQNLRVRVKDTSKQEAGAIFKPGKKNSDNGYFLAIYCESRTFSLTDDGVQS